MASHLFPAILSAALVASVASAQAPALIKPGSALAWSTPVGHGTLKIVAVDNLYFEADQTNELNKAAGTIRLYGAFLDSGRRVMLVQPGQWKAVWDGTASASEIAGKLVQGGASYAFKITAAAPAAVVVNLAPFLTGKTLKWATDAGQNGTMHVTSVTGTTFLVDQTNVKNVAAGIIKLDGEVKDGKVYLYNRKWNETWIGTASNGLVTGKVNNSTPFTITGQAPAQNKPQPEPDPVGTAPFLSNNSLRWSTAAGAGYMHIGESAGIKFNLEQSNDKDQGQEANFTEMDGEIKDGKVYLYNRGAKETWIGTIVNGVVTGTINNKAPFKIVENK